MISTYPKDIYESLEFDKILALLKEAVLSDVALRRVEQLSILTDKKKIQHLLDETEQYKRAMEDDKDLPMSIFYSVEEDLPLLRKENYVLPIESIQRIYRLIHIAKELMAHFSNPVCQNEYNLLHAIVAQIDIDPSLLKSIDSVLDDDGNVRPDASPELLRISKDIRSKERELDKVFADALKSASSNGYLAETSESLRNGRRVLTVASEHKRKINGVIHDESATGKTVYLEPNEVMPINNAIFNLYTERKKEIYKVLQRLCNELRPYADSIQVIETVLTRLDIIRAKARVAQLMGAQKPVLQGGPHLGLKQAYNPILYLKNKQIDKQTVSFDLDLHGANRIIIISGPNAGGKSVTMKTVGLLQMMIQFGMLVPAHENSKFGVFKKIYADIGDQQSVEDDLSTYSSRLKNMKYFIEKADKNTLVIIDEFGSGTDPKIGGSIAEAILRELNYKQCYGVITTHYSNLKYYAFKAKGLLNGSMEFDQAKLSPTYQLIVGKPGSSFAFEIAEKIGLNGKVLKYARHKTGKNEKAIEELLTNLQSEKKEVEDKLEKLMAKEEKLDKMVKAYDQLHKELEFRRKKLKLEKREHKLVSTSHDNRKIDELIKELQKEKDLEKAKAKAKEIKAIQSQARDDIAAINEDIYGNNLGEVQNIKKGDHVKMRSGDAEGEVLEIDKKTAIVQMGILKLTVPLHELQIIGEPIKTYKKSVRTDIVNDGSRFESKIDIRGYKKSDAEDAIQRFLDHALISNVSHLKVIHGVGNGVLSKLLRKMASEYPDIKKLHHPEEEYGGAGVTIIEF